MFVLFCFDDVALFCWGFIHQVKMLSAELHAQQKQETKTDAETQTERHTWTETEHHTWTQIGWSDAASAL